MELIRDTVDFRLRNDTAAAIGKFDGVHIGHRKLLEEILSKKSEGLKACVFTFDPPPAVLFGLSDGRELSTKEEKREIFERLGVDILIEFPLTRETADIPAEEFVREYLCERMRVRFLAAGEDVSFGRKGAGNAELLRRFSKAGISGETHSTQGQPGGYEFSLIEKICVDGTEVSSTGIRNFVERGDMEQAKKLLGEPYAVCGRVVHGNRIGRTLGFPTVNLVPAGNKLLPPNGVYLSEVEFNGKVYRAISNVGCKPTVTDERKMGVESYLYDFDEEIYGAQVSVRLLHFMRPERKFSDVEELKAQLEKDIAVGKNMCY